MINGNELRLVSLTELKEMVSEIIKEQQPSNTKDEIITYTRVEVCRMLNISHPTLIKLQKQKKLEGKIIGNQKYIYTEADIKAYLAKK